jgi:hypothetical protein
MRDSKTKSYMDIDASDQIVSHGFVATPTAHNEHSLLVQDTFVFPPDLGRNNFNSHSDVIHINHAEFANVDATSTTYTYTTIVPPGSDYTIASSINDKGQIVGLYQDSNGEHGFLEDHGTYTTIDPPGSIETVAEAINNKGQIIGFYFDRSGTHQASSSRSAGRQNSIYVHLRHLQRSRASRNERTHGCSPHPVISPQRGK